MPKIGLIAILGTDRSGSTLIDMVIGSNPEIVSLGEIHHLSTCIKRDEMCGCGVPLSQCLFWQRILKTLQKEGFTADQFTILGWRKRIGLMVKGAMTRGRVLKDKCMPYAEAYARLCGSIMAETGANWICDSCKDATRISLLKMSGLFNIVPIYITRPVEDYILSVRRPQMRLDPARKVGPVKAILRWFFRNLETRLQIGSILEDYFQVTYETFTSDPGRIIGLISRKYGISLRYDPAEIKGADYHLIAGNSMKLKRFSGITPEKKDTTQVLSSFIRRSAISALNYFFVRDRF